MMNLSPAVRRALALAILLLAVYVPVAVLVVPLISQYWELRERSEIYADLLRRFRTSAASTADVQERLQETRRTVDLTDSYLFGDNPSLIAADLQQRIKRVVESAQAKLGSTQVLPMTVSGTSSRIGIRVQLNADTSQLLRILHTIESSRPYLFVDRLDINAQRGRSLRNRQKTDGDSLRVTLDVFGYLRPG